MRDKNVFWPSVLILAGVVLLMSNLGLLPRNAWGTLWPLFLIMLGGWILLNAARGTRNLPVEPAAVPLDGATRAEIKLHHGAGRLAVQGGAGTGLAFEGTFGGGVKTRTQRTGDLLSAKVSVPDDGMMVFSPAMWGARGGLEWNMALSSEVPLDLELETGASETWLDLTNTRLARLRLQTGASSTEVTMPAAAGQTIARMSMGAASLRVYVPGGVAARIRVESGLASINIDQTRFPHSGDYYESPDFALSPNRVEMEIETGVGSVTVR